MNNQSIKYDFNLFSLKNDVDKFFGKAESLSEYYKEGKTTIDFIKKFLNTNIYKPSKTGITYKKLFDLTKLLLDLGEKRERGKWRKLSLKQLIFIDMIIELKDSYGFTKKQLKPLSELFFSESYGNFMDHALVDVFMEIKVSILLEGRSRIYVYDDIFFLDNNKINSYVSLNLNNIVKNVFDRIGIKKSNIYFDKFFQMKCLSQNNALLDIIYNKKFSVITIKKKQSDDNSYIVKAKETKEISKDELMEAIETKQYADINIIKRDGGIVRFQVEDTFKIKLQ